MRERLGTKYNKSTFPEELNDKPELLYVSIEEPIDIRAFEEELRKRNLSLLESNGQYKLLINKPLLLDILGIFTVGIKVSRQQPRNDSAQEKEITRGVQDAVASIEAD